MNQRIKDVWVIPTTITLVAGIGFLFLGPWLTGTPIRPSFSLAWLKIALLASLPVWVTLTMLVMAAVFGGLFLRQKSRTREESAQKDSAVKDARQLKEQIEKLEQQHGAEIDRLKSNEPRLHAVWRENQTFWGDGRKGEEPLMQIGGWIDLTSSNTEEVLFLLAAYIEGQRSDIFMEVAVKPHMVNREQVVLYMIPPLATDATKPFSATIVVEDQYNRRHVLPTHSFRGIGKQRPVPAAAAEKAGPVLLTSWRGDSAWGWASAHPDMDPIYVIRGELTMVVDNVDAPVTITGVEIEDAQTIGTFENFKLDPGQPQTRAMRLHFRGKAPKGNDYYTIQLTFKDLRGNRYPTVEHRFHPLPIPERVAIERGTPRG